MRSLICDYCATHPYWRQELSCPPYSLKIVEQDGLALFKYTMGVSCYNEPLVLEARGFIMDCKTCAPVCYPFNKFFNYGENWVATIDWNSAKVLQKVDGSLICFWWRENSWHFSTTGTINGGILAEKIKRDLAATHFNTQNLDRNYTYMFEWISPTNRIVVPWNRTAFVLLGRRNMKTLREEPLAGNEGFETPISYPLHSLNDVVAAASKLNWRDEEGEGFVVVDKNWNRIKVKSLSYIEAHYARNNGKISFKTLWEVFLAKEESEFCAYLPEAKPLFDDLRAKVENFRLEAEQAQSQIHNYSSRKELAQKAKQYPKMVCAYILFQGTFEEFLQQLSIIRAKELFKIDV